MAKAKVKRASVARPAPAPKEAQGISAIAVEGFKSLRERTEIAVRPLTILAGANSSGKSSIMQPLLLMKQTLEAPYDPGALLLDGPHVQFTLAEQLFTRGARKPRAELSVSIEVAHGERVEVRYDRLPGGGLDVAEMLQSFLDASPLILRRGMSRAELEAAVKSTTAVGWVAMPHERGEDIAVRRVRCFFDSFDYAYPAHDTMALVADELRAALHIPAHRGGPERTYKTTAVGPAFPGPFLPYVASVVHHWQATSDVRLKQLGASLARLGLNWKVEAARLDDTRVELRVGRLKQKGAGGARDLVSIADVGFGVSQCLPVLVALLTAEPGQLVYIEEPEIHLHPRAQVALAELLADAANRGVRVVIETHSALLLTGVQALVAEGALPAERVALHWFSLDDEGMTEVKSAELDEAGSFGEWPEDFAEVTLDAQARYLDAAEKRLRKATR